VYDIRELQVGDEEDRLVSPLVGSLEKERGVLVDDPRWQGEQNLVCSCCYARPLGWCSEDRSLIGFNEVHFSRVH